ncbi:MAG: tetratricopeptide repeat protein [Mycobacteriales bacterium]
MPAESDGRRPPAGRRPAAGGGQDPRRGRSEPHAPRPAGPPLPDEADVRLLPRAVQRALATLAPDLAELTGRHLAAAGLLIDEDPARAVAHARFAKERAARLPETREALGVAAYADGDFALARTELRAARRMSGAPELIPLLADCERALGRPDAALELAALPDTARLGRDDRLELAMVVSGARLDLGQAAQAVAVLSLPELDASDAAAAASPAILRLWYAYADALDASGRRAEAADRMVRVAELDDQGVTDAAERFDGQGEPPGHD